MITYKVNLSADKKTVYVGKDTVAFPGGGTDLGTYVHDDPTDPLGALKSGHSRHFEHIREILGRRSWANPANAALFPNNIIDMASIKIVRYGAAETADYLSAANVTRAGAGTITPVVKYRTEVGDVGGVNAVLTDFNWVSSDPTKATVSAAGVITYVAVGVTNITATEKNGTKSVTFKATMT
ncbi:hypothetical protein X766_16115 [Mesorhizobium sp. LSJC255A00]|uniref:Ig-like domain-containing protein n=1 Tax=Mesorhizobium sp. LSJC255A00 TaxID=1287313 RepID=UPI0003CF7A2F|nr:Ig-like domain-containing protein [Mesorhizobium sp. LSJC255A00]ESX17909.1 hypothetical protein X766_16115 [Mesorhizobium sp. LSJC255A00]